MGRENRGIGTSSRFWPASTSPIASCASSPQSWTHRSKGCFGVPGTFQRVLLRDHPRDPDQFFGQDLIARLESRQTVRSLRAEARALIPEEWAERIEARWRATQANQSRNAPMSHTILSSSPVEQRPPDDPQTPPGLIDPPRSATLIRTTYRVGFAAKP